MIFKLLKLLILIFFSWPSLASDNFQVSLGGFLSTQQVYRGAQVWTRPSGMVGPSFTFWKVLSLRGPNIVYSPFDRKSSFDLNVSLRFFDDNSPLLSLGNHEEDHRNRRKNSLELGARFRYKFGFRKKFFVGAALFHDTISYKGAYTELSVGAPLLPFTSISTTLSLAPEKSNQYLYGPEATGGIGHHTTSLTFVWPFLPWKGIIINRLDYSYLPGGQNRHSDYVRGDHTHVNYSLSVIWNI